MDRLKILIPTDFTVQAEFAYLIVKKLEEKTPVDIHFLHVMQVPDTVTMNADGNIETCGEIDLNYVQSHKEIAERKLGDLKVVYGEHINTHLLLGKTTAAIIAFAESHGFDLIAMGTKGASGLKETLSGSETQMVARKSKVPVLSLMCDRSDLQIKNILLVHNFNHPAEEALSLMQKFIQAFDTKFHLLQIVSGTGGPDKAVIENNMKSFAALNHLSNFTCHVINDTDVEQGVIHFTQQIEMDLICIGTHGKGGIFHQSVTEKLINHIYKPIISFHLKQ